MKVKRSTIKKRGIKKENLKYKGLLPENHHRPVAERPRLE